MARARTFLVLTVMLFHCFTFSKSEESSDQQQPVMAMSDQQMQQALLPLLDPETANVLREIRPDIRPRFLLPGWKPWIPIKLPLRPTTPRSTATMAPGG